MIWALFASFGKRGERSMAEPCSMARLTVPMHWRRASGADSGAVQSSWSRQVTFDRVSCQAARHVIPDPFF